MNIILYFLKIVIYLNNYFLMLDENTFSVDGDSWQYQKETIS
jgi:hypothetical protein